MPPRAEGRPSIAELMERHERNSAFFADVARRMQADGRLDETFVDHYDYSQSIGATIIHVVLHNAQHRAEARPTLGGLGVEDGWEGEPREWEPTTGRISPERRPADAGQAADDR